jgi:serine/threonine protein kinase
VKLIDFGLVRGSMDLGKTRLTETGVPLGTAQYMSPEQCTGKELDERSDIYAIGCILQCCLTGQPPFVGEYSMELLVSHLNDAPPPLSKFLEPGSFSPALQTVIHHALTKNKEDRYASTAELKQDLERIQLKQFENIEKVNKAAITGTAHNPLKKRSRTPLVVASVLGLGLLAVTGLALCIRDTPSQQEGPGGAAYLPAGAQG